MRFSYLIWLSAFILAGCAAFISVFGLGHLFAGAGTAVLIMVGGLEFAKLIAATTLHRYWLKLSTLLRIYLTTGVIVLIGLTSTGIYGFLSNGYQKTASKLNIHNSEVAILEGKKQIFEKELLGNENIVTNKTNRMSQLSNLRGQQEVRLDTLIANNNWSNVKKTREDIEKATTEIAKLNAEIDGIVTKNSVLSDSINKYQRLILEQSVNDNVSLEVGPLVYLSNITGLSMDRVVNYLIIIIMLVFDPMAVCLLLAANKVFFLEKEIEEAQNKNDEPIKVKERQANELPIVTIDDTQKITDFDVEDDNIETPLDIIDEEPLSASTIDVELVPPPIQDNKKRKPVIPTGEITKDDLEIIRNNRGFSVNIPDPKPTNVDDDRIWLKKKRNGDK